MSLELKSTFNLRSKIPWVNNSLQKLYLFDFSVFLQFHDDSQFDHAKTAILNTI